jgi:hypothetical protein
MLHVFNPRPAAHTQVDALQGQEADLCIVSAVRAPQPGGGRGNQHGLGFLDDNRRTNVMLSRAQQLLVIVGDAGAWFRGPQGSLLRAFAAMSLAEGTCFGVVGEFGEPTAASPLVALSAKGLSPSLVRLGLASHMPAAELLDGIWRAPLPDFVPSLPDQEDRGNRTKRYNSSTAPKQSTSGSNASASAGNSNRSSAIRGESGTSGGPVSEAPKQSNRGSNVAGSARKSSPGGAIRGGSGISGGPKAPTPEAIVATLRELSKKNRYNRIPGIVLMKRFPKGSWTGTTQATKAFCAAGLRLSWQGSKFTVWLPKSS